MVKVQGETDLYRKQQKELEIRNPRIRQIKLHQKMNENHSVKRRKVFDLMKDKALKKDIERRDRQLLQDWKQKLKF